ncbi:MAG: adenylosuccinate synthase [Kiritimatiellia bacterium]
MKREAWLVLDLGFGDAGKGSITDFLVRDRKVELVVRFNGGAQAGHNVVESSGRHHTFSQFTAGTLAGAAGLLGPDFVLHPLGMWMEAQHLIEVGVANPWARTEVDDRALLITPYQQAAGRAREVVRGADAHGTCGVGVGEAVGDRIDHPDDALRAADLHDVGRLRHRLRMQRERKRAELRALGTHDDIFDDDDLIDRVIDMWGAVADRLQLRTTRQALTRIANAERVVFEGAQGVLLDQDWGFHPHTTWSDCTPAGALRLAGDRPVTRLGLTRAYGVRHGAGPFPTEGGVEVQEHHNQGSGWQGSFRTGALDGVLLRYALEVCGGVDALVVTCLDRGRSGSVCHGYRDAHEPGLGRNDGGLIRSIIPGERGDLDHRERLGRWLRTVEPAITEADIVAFVHAATGQRVWLESLGPTAGDKRWLREPG